MVFIRRKGASRWCGDIQQFYNTILLHKDHWKYQKALIKPNLDPSAETVLGIITTIIYGFCPLGNMFEKVIKLLEESTAEEFSEAAMMLLKKR